MIRDTLHDLHRPPGDAGPATSLLGLDTAKFGRDQRVKYPSGFTTPDNREAADLLALIHDLGVNLIDITPIYGRNKECLGSLLRGQHEHWMIVSKVGEEFVDGQLVFDFSATHTRRSIERSLKCLETERIGLVLVYSDDNDLDILENSEVYPVLAALKCEGLIGAYGLPGKTVEGSLHALREGDYTMVIRSLNGRAERPVIECVVVHAKGTLVKRALASGHVCLDVGQDPMRVSFGLVFGQPSAAIAIAGAIDPLHLAHNVAMAAQALKGAWAIHRLQHPWVDTCGAFRCHVPPGRVVSCLPPSPSVADASNVSLRLVSAQ